MDVEARIRELKRELEYLEAQRSAPQGMDPRMGMWTPEPQADTPYIQKMPYRQGAESGSGPYMQNMPYKKPAPSLDGPRRPNQYIKKL